MVLVRFSSALMLGLAVLFLSTLFGPRAHPAALVGVAVPIAVAGALVWLAFYMRKPILTIDNEAVRTHAVFGKGSMLLRSITAPRLGTGGRSLIVDAEGGIALRGKPTSRKWLTINGIHTYQVGPMQLRDYIVARGSGIAEVGGADGVRRGTRSQLFTGLDLVDQADGPLELP